jgi:hypothetical protein
VIMFYVGIQLLLGGMDKALLGWILIITAIIFTVLGFIIAFGDN